MTSAAISSHKSASSARIVYMTFVLAALTTIPLPKGNNYGIFGALHPQYTFHLIRNLIKFSITNFKRKQTIEFENVAQQIYCMFIKEG